jgi:hypothetical protein
MNNTSYSLKSKVRTESPGLLNLLKTNTMPGTSWSGNSESTLSWSTLACTMGSGWMSSKGIAPSHLVASGKQS